MSISKQPHNVSVRFSEEDYKQLMFLQDKFSRMSYGKVSLADVLRIATKELYNIESADMNRPITREKSYTPKETVQISDSEIKDQEIVVKVEDPENNKELTITEKIKEESLSNKIERENQLLQEAQQEQQNNS
ncbi:hypothetical protein ACQ3VF_26180 [Bacillus toyonensis]|uniref:hypothetical protein n=1 Tax=Bacillus toyonensis TaxID=155322 RepID=UPI003D301841